MQNPTNLQCCCRRRLCGLSQSAIHGLSLATERLVRWHDHLGSVRALVQDNGSRRNQNYYWAFGEDAGGEVHKSHQYRYTGKPLDEEFDLNLHYYGARYLSAPYGRFTQVDPLRGKYPSWSPYVYTLDNPLKYVDPDGRAPGDRFMSPNAAAHDWAMTYHSIGLVLRCELGSYIYHVNSRGSVWYSYAEPTVGTWDRVRVEWVNAPLGDPQRKQVAGIHDHVVDFGLFPGEQFSETDRVASLREGIPLYLVNPQGELLLYDLATRSADLVASDLPKDPYCDWTGSFRLLWDIWFDEIELPDGFPVGGGAFSPDDSDSSPSSTSKDGNE